MDQVHEGIATPQRTFGNLKLNLNVGVDAISPETVFCNLPLINYFSRVFFRNVHLDLKSSEYSQLVGGREGSKSNPPEIDGRYIRNRIVYFTRPV